MMCVRRNQTGPAHDARESKGRQSVETCGEIVTPAATPALLTANYLA
jgi:hypothetical protein